MKKIYFSIELQVISLCEDDVLTFSAETGGFGADGEDDYGYDIWD